LQLTGPVARTQGMRAILFMLVLLVACAAAAEVTPRGLAKVKDAPATLPPTEIASFAAG
jgi:hypothetical protein